jgi:hypothetical protein
LVFAETNSKIVVYLVSRRQFASELGENKVVRLIFNGRVLDNESRTLKESGIFDQCVVHCLVVTPQAAPPAGRSGGTGSGIFFDSSRTKKISC